MVRGVAHHFDALSNEALHGYLTGAAVERGERFVIEQRGDQWFAELRTETGLGGQTVHLGDEATTLSGEAVILGMPGPDRRTAMARLADRLATAG